MIFSKNKQDKRGIPPGTLVYSGKKQTEKVRINLIEYNADEFIEKDFYDLDECMRNLRPDMVRWINIDGIHDINIIEQVGKMFDIHPLTLEDIVNTDQRPKFEDYEDYVVAIMKMLYYETGLRAEQLTIVLKENTVISFQEVHGGDAFDLIRTRLRQNKGRVRKLGADYLAYALVDAVVDCYFSLLEKIGDYIEVLEDDLIKEPSKDTLTSLHSIKREMIFLRKAVWPLRELINNMERSESELIKSSTDVYLRDLYDHTVRVIDTVETYRDLLSGMMDIYLSSVSNKMNEVMKVLTIISTIFIPVTFIAGVYGMNFDYMPELHSKWGYVGVWIVMIAVMLIMVRYFRKKKWL
jgi:magnesium transporter